MAKIKLKKPLELALENSKQALIKTISESMLQQPVTEEEIAWLLLEFTLEYPFPPTIAIAQKSETKNLDKDEHPLIAYNAPDLELFSENGNIILKFDPYDDLFDTVNVLLEEIEYEDRQPFIFQLYVEVCKALMLESSNWKHLDLADDFHVTARDFEICDEVDYLEKILPKKAFRKIKKKIDAYDAKLSYEYANDKTIIKVNAVMLQESDRYEEIISTLTMDSYTDVYTQEECCFIEPYYIESHFHKRSEDIDWELSTHKPQKQLSYFHYKFSNNIPQLVDYYHLDKLVWRKIFQYKKGIITTHKFFLNTEIPQIDSYKILTELSENTVLYEEYKESQFHETTYYKNQLGQLENALQNRSIFYLGHKSDTSFEYTFEYKNDALFKIISTNPNKKAIVSYCRDESFMEEAISDFIEHICDFTLRKLQEHPISNLKAIVLEYDNNLALYFNIQLLLRKKLVSISNYELYEDDSNMMNLTVYTTASRSNSNKDYFSNEKAEAFIDKTYKQLCAVLSERVAVIYNIKIPVVCKYIYDDLHL